MGNRNHGIVPARVGSSAVAALHVELGRSHFGLEDVEPWDGKRDARQYRGPHPVVAHPPCQRWGKLWAGQPLHIKRTDIRDVDEPRWRT